MIFGQFRLGLLCDRTLNLLYPNKELTLIKCQSCHHIETSHLICRANQLTGFYMMATLAFNELMLVLCMVIQIQESYKFNNLDDGTLKSAVSQEWSDKLSLRIEDFRNVFFNCWSNITEDKKCKL